MKTLSRANEDTAGGVWGNYFYRTAIIPYPETVSCKAVAKDNSHVLLSVPYKYVNEIQKGNLVRIEFEGFPTNKYNYKTGQIVEMSKAPILKNDSNEFMVQILISKTGYEVYPNMSGTAFILIDKQDYFTASN